MDETLLEIAKTLAPAAAAFIASWLGLVRPLAGRVKREAASFVDIEAIKREQAKAQGEVARAREEAVKLRAEVEGMGRDVCKMDQAVEKLKESQGKNVTEEEFAAYSSTMSQNLQTLVERLGNATGAIEAWYRSQGGGR